MIYTNPNGSFTDTFTPQNTENNLKRSNREPSNCPDNNTSLVSGSNSAQNPADAINHVAKSMEIFVGRLMTRKNSASTS